MQSKPILVVDDEKNIRLTLKESLETIGMSVNTAVNGEEALTMLETGGYGIVLLDLKMPGIDGMEVLRRIRMDNPTTRVIIITAHGTIEAAVEAMKLGAVDFIQKPFTPNEIRELVTTVLSREDIVESEEQTLDYAGLIELAKRHITDRRFDDAMTVVKHAIGEDPEKPESYNLLGALNEIKGDILKAQKFYRAAWQIDPSYQPSKANLSRTTSFGSHGSISLGEESNG